jgi:hypothetical protein
MVDLIRRSKPAWVQTGVTVCLLVVLFAAYIAAMHATVPLSKKTGASAIDRRDLWYVIIHGSVLGAGAVLGFLAGKWYSGLGIAFALLFLAVLAAGMVGIQLGAFEAACRGHNDIVRHWTCSAK